MHPAARQQCTQWQPAFSWLRSMRTAGPGVLEPHSSHGHSTHHVPKHEFKPQNIWCVGRNYADHVKELGNQQQAPGDAPMIFLKAGSSLLPAGAKLLLPSWSSDVHHEVELAIELDDKLDPIRGAVGIDLTARDVQDQLKKKRWPWTLAKSFPNSTLLGSSFALRGHDVQKLELHLSVNGKVRQHGSTSLMLYDVPTLLDYVRTHFPVLPGDVVLTGTPAGVSPMVAGDKVEASVLQGGKQLSHGSWEVVRE